MSVSANFTTSYKIPRRQNNGETSVSERKLAENTASPLSRNITPKKNHPSTSKQQSRSGNTSQHRTSKNQTQSSHYRISTFQQHKDASKKYDQAERGTKRRIAESQAAAYKQRRQSNDDPMELLDRIWKEMDEDDNNRRKKSEDQQRDGSITPTDGLFMQAATPIPSSKTPKLTKHELINAQQDDSIFKSFLTKPGLMERILGYKMQYSRVDTYEIMKRPAKLEQCEGIDDKEVDYGVPSYQTEVVPCSSKSEADQTHRKGPKTPPGSPNHEADEAALSTYEWHTRSIHSPSSHHSKHDQTIPVDNLCDKQFSSRSELLQSFSQATNTPVEKLEKLIGPEIHDAFGRVAKSVLLTTLRDTLRNLSSKPNSPKSQPNRSRIIQSDAVIDSPAHQMSCSSTESNASSEKSLLLLPPPPMPPSKPTISNVSPIINVRQNSMHVFNKPPPINASTSGFIPRFNELPPAVRPISAFSGLPCPVPPIIDVSRPPPPIGMPIIGIRPPILRLPLGPFNRPPPIQRTFSVPPPIPTERSVLNTLMRSIRREDQPAIPPFCPYQPPPKRP